MVNSCSCQPSASHAYLLLLSVVLCGYALIGKSVAYLGMPPLYIGEITLFLGLVTLLGVQYFTVMFASLPSLLLAAMMMWVIFRTTPFVGAYSFDALRDSMVIMYGCFSFIVIGLILDDPRRIDVLLARYGWMIGIFAPLLPLSIIAEKFFRGMIPFMPGTDIPILQLRPGEGAVHTAGAIVYVMAGFRRATKSWIVGICIALLLGVESRGALLAEILPIVFAGLMLGKVRQMLRIAVGGLALFAVAYAIEPVFIDYSVPRSSAERPISTRQLVGNVMGSIGQGDRQGENTKVWRLYWWDLIIADTVQGPHF